MTQINLAWLTASALAIATVSLAEDRSDDQKRPEPFKVGLWNGRAPVNNQEFEQAEVWITVHRASANPSAAVVICPGGGYGGLVTGAEGHGIAEWLQGQGITGIVLEYRLPKGRSMVPLLDAQRAIRVVRARADEWSIDPNRIGVIGFSAGGHLASTTGTHFDQGNPSATDAMERISCRPDFMILVYPVIMFNEQSHVGSMKNLLGTNPTPEQMKWFSSEKQVTAKTPPTFLAHALNDRIVPAAHSKAFHEALLSKGVASKYLELPTGDHGLNGYKGPMWDTWQRESLEWLKQISGK
jgi:acetyl esterase/lipase